MRVLVIGGMHGNEPLGLSLVRLLQQKPVENVDTLLANEKAIAAGVRFMKQDLNRSFPGSITSSAYESRRAAEILKIATEYDVVLDFHNTYCPNNDCCFVGESAEQDLYDKAWILGLERAVVADYDCINKCAPNCLSVEVSMDSELNDPKIWYEKIQKLSELKGVGVGADIERYRFVYRMTQEDNQRLALDEQSLMAFEPIKKDLADALGVRSPAYPIFIGDAFTPYNYGGVLNRLEYDEKTGL